MTQPTGPTQIAARHDPPLRTLSLIASIWVLSDIGYYLLLPKLGADAGYNAAPVTIAVYYVFWTGVAVIMFWPLYSGWVKFENRLASCLLWILAFGGCTLFAAYIFPSLPQTRWSQSWTAPDVATATEHYFLPKSIDILYQQLLILALVLSLSTHGYGIKKLSLLCAAMFGGAHVLLAFGGMPLGYVIRFMLAASLFGALFPWLILRLPNGLGLSYILHWVYYAITVAMPRIFSAPI